MNKRHFTLLELSIAVGILAVVMAVAGMALQGAQQTWRKVSEQDGRLRQYQAIDRIAETAFRNAIPFNWQDRNNKEALCFDGKSDSVMLPYLHRIGNRELGAIRFLRLYVKDGGLYAEYRHTPVIPLESDHDDNFELELLADNVKAIKLCYADYDKEKLVWYDSWDNDRLKNLPVALQLEVEFADGAKQVWLRRTAGNGFYEQLRTRKAPLP